VSCITDTAIDERAIGYRIPLLFSSMHMKLFMAHFIGAVILACLWGLDSVSALQATTSSDLLVSVTSTASAQATFTYNPDSATIDWTLSIDNPDQRDLLGASLGAGGVQLQCGVPLLPTFSGDIVATLVPPDSVSDATLSYNGVITDSDIMPESCGTDVYSLFSNMVMGNVFFHVYSEEYWMDGELRGRIGSDVPDVAIDLSGDAVVPPVDTFVFGTAQFTLDEDSNVMGYSLYENNLYSVNMFGNGAHIHCGASNENGPVVVELVSSGATQDDEVTVYGILESSDIVDTSCGATITDLLTSLQDGSAYVVIHSDENPDGEIRGQRSSSEASISMTAAPTTETTQGDSTTQEPTIATTQGDSTQAPTSTATTNEGDSTEEASTDGTKSSTKTVSEGGITTVTTSTTPKNTASNGGGSGTIGTGLNLYKQVIVPFILVMTSASLI
jgi:hypothetical protein